MRRILFWFGTMLVIAGMPGSSLAAKAHRPKLILVDLPADKAFEANVIKVVNSLLAKDLRDQGFDVITPSDIGAALGVERQKQLLGCTESSCLAEIGGALGAEYIVHGELATLDQGTALTLTLTDDKGHALSEVGGVLSSKSSSVVLAAIEQDVPKLVKPLRDAGKLGGSPNAASAPNLTSVPPSATTSTSTAAVAPSSEEPSRVPSYALLGGGAVLVVGSVVVGVLANSDYATLKTDSLAGTSTAATQAQSLQGKESGEAWASTGLLAGGIIAVGIGAALWFLEAPDSVHPATTAGAGGGLSLEF